MDPLADGPRPSKKTMIKINSNKVLTDDKKVLSLVVGDGGTYVTIHSTTQKALGRKALKVRRLPTSDRLPMAGGFAMGDDGGGIGTMTLSKETIEALRRLEERGVKPSTIDAYLIETLIRMASEESHDNPSD